ncbi:uncharacterized protein LOC144620418 [Crassostrea virginica]
MLIEQSDRRHELHQEMLAKYNSRSQHLSMDVIRKLEYEESRRRILQNELLDLVAELIEQRKNPPVFQIMGMMLEHHRKRQKVDQELMMKLLQKELFGIRRHIFLMENMMKLLQKEGAYGD